MELQDHWILAQDTTSETSVIQEPFPLTWVECHAISWQGFTDWVHWESHGSPVPCLLFSRSVVSVSLQPHGLKHARLPCPSLSPKVFSNSCPLNWWCHPSISSSVTRFSCPQSFPPSESFPISQLFTLGGQSIRVSASASVLPMNIQGWFPLGLTGLILPSMGLSRVSSNTSPMYPCYIYKFSYENSVVCIVFSI